jgi:hypothetical protein
VVPHRMIPERLCLLRTIPHYVTNQPNSQNAGALGVADALLAHLNEPDAQALLAEANAPGQSSLLVQQSFAAFSTGAWFPE